MLKIKLNCCTEKPVISLYSGEKLCRNHFTEYFENKVFKTIRQFDLIEKEEKLGVAISGGKDSLTVLRILSKLAKENPKIRNEILKKIRENLKKDSTVAVKGAPAEE